MYAWVRLNGVSHCYFGPGTSTKENHRLIVHDVHVVIIFIPGSWTPAQIFHTIEECSKRVAALSRFHCTDCLRTISSTLLNSRTPDYSTKRVPQLAVRLSSKW